MPIAALDCGFFDLRHWLAQSLSADECDGTRNPWEALQVVEGRRSLQGMAVYELPPDGHATHNYGALVPWVQGQIFRWAGPNNVTGRLLSVVSALLLVTLLAIGFAGERSAWALAITFAALMGVDHRSGHYFAENRPDMTALFLGAVAVVFLSFGLERQALATGCSRDGVPRSRFLLQANCLDLRSRAARRFIHALRRPARSELVLAGIPLLVMASVILCLGLFSPAVYHYMIAVQRGYSINWPRAAKFFWELLLDSPLFLVLLAELVFFGEGLRRSDPPCGGSWRCW